MNRPPFACFLIGSDTLLTECADVLLQRGHTISGIVTSGARVQSWAKARGLRTLSEDSYRQVLAAESFDYLFAITHLSLISDAVLALPGRAAINFHDGPLPRYAGLNAPAWALLNGEERYGVSWHVITAGVDEGEVLEQRFFEIDHDETSLSLNTKCFAAGLESFSELIPKLEQGSETRTAQDLSERTVYFRNDRPDRLGYIDVEQSSEAISRWVRALDFGAYPNPLAAAKVETALGPVLVGHCEFLEDAEDDATPGTIIAHRDLNCVVQTGTGPLLLGGLKTPSGQPLDENSLNQGLSVGQLLARPPSLEPWAHTARHEPWWLRQLRDLEPAELPVQSVARGAPAVPQVLRWSFPDAVAQAQHPKALVHAAFLAWLARVAGTSKVSVGYASSALRAALGPLDTTFATEVPLTLSFDRNQSCSDFQALVTSKTEELEQRSTFLRDLIGRHPDLSARPELRTGLLPVALDTHDPKAETYLAPGTQLTLAVGQAEVALVFDSAQVSPEDQHTFSAQFRVFLGHFARGGSVGSVSLLSDEEKVRVLSDWNQTTREYDRTLTLSQLFESQVERSPEAIAVVFENESITYRTLNERANQLARYLRAHQVGPDTLVGVYIERSLDLLVSIYAIHKAGGAYLPLDPAFPDERVQYMIEDAKAPVVLSQTKLAARIQPPAKVIRVDGDRPNFELLDRSNLDSSTHSSNLAYVIYTSGSTGRPKGVMVEHRTVHNFFVGMDDRIPVEVGQKQPCWMAVTSLSFDISVLELFWTLARGFKVVVYRDRVKDTTSVPAAIASRPMGFGMFMWGNDDGPGPQKYELMLEGAKYLDRNGFNSIWTPERHFHAFGGPYPNPSVTGAALAVVTENMSIRSGSCVSPLHHPVRIAEEWAVVDNLSNGRVGLSFASGWQPNDFILRPESYGDDRSKPKNKQVMLEQIETVRKLWRGEKVAFPNPFGDMVEVETLPRPVQPELPFWVTTAGNPATYEQAGRLGANILTHLLGQSFDEVAEKIALYRTARAEAGFDPKTGIVTLMLHTLLAESRQKARQLAHQPLKDYLGSSVALVKGFAWTFPAFKRPEGEQASPMDIDLSSLSEEELDAILEYAFDRYFETSGLFGTVDEAIDIVNRAKSIDVNEIACLLDFGAPTPQVKESLPRVAEVATRTNATVGMVDEAGQLRDFSLAAQIRAHAVTHLQCTPSMARMMMLDEEASSALAQIEHMMVGGEAFPPDLAQTLAAVVSGSVTNMYGPTETTIWSSTHAIAKDSKAESVVPIGKPIANTTMYLLDRYMEPVPVGTPGELWVGGEGVVRGYFERPHLTEERFRSDPFSQIQDARMYRTGDLARWNDAGELEFMGRIDHQVKVRGYRIELGEIEAKILDRGDVREAVVVVLDQGDEKQLVAYVVAQATSSIDVDAVKTSLRSQLPEYMVPTTILGLDAMPLTPNGKIDRKQLPSPEAVLQASDVQFVPPEGELERKIAEVWQATLGKGQVGLDDNFFDIGGHSLLVVRVHRSLKALFDEPIQLTDLYRFPTIRALTEHLGGQGAGAVDAGVDRAALRKQRGPARRRRR